MMWKKKTTDLKKKSPNLKNKLDTVFSRFIRLRDARKDGTFQCISCGRILPLDQADCGHYGDVGIGLMTIFNTGIL